MRRKRQPRVMRCVGIEFHEEPLLSPKLHLEKDTFSGGYNNTIRARNDKRRAEWHEKNDRIVRINPHVDALGIHRPAVILVPSHLWDSVMKGLTICAPSL